MNGNITTLIVSVIAALVIGVLGGYYYGEPQGRANLLLEQAAEEETAKKAAQDQIAEAANPFGTQVNPLGGGYKNPFEGASVNPFAE